jgi:excisionase family DNA binding protein
MTDQSISFVTSQLRDCVAPKRDRENESLTLTVSEAATLLGISRALAYELVARGEIPSLRLGRRVVVPRGALVSMIESVE